jgi:hypothetical protein
MPIHDWTHVDAGLFYDFHQDWTIELRRSLNAGRLPAGFVALVDQQTAGFIPDVLTLSRRSTVTEETKTAYVEPVAVGDELPGLPIFLTGDVYVPAPLEESYKASWAAFPTDFKPLLEPPAGD